jgi:hypothetical protein
MPGQAEAAAEAELQFDLDEPAHLSR